MVDEFVFLADSPLHIALHLSRGGESIVECYILSPYIEKFCGIMVCGKFSCGTYVIVVFPDMRNLFLSGSAIFSMVLSSSSIFLCGVTVFHIPLAAPKAALMSDWSTRDHVTLPNSKWRQYLHRLFIPVERRLIAA